MEGLFFGISYGSDSGVHGLSGAGIGGGMVS